jgi:N-hydroxyarylamine O-acetyltransferase
MLQATNFNLNAYLERISFKGTAAASLASISAMMRQQLHTVPFENLDVQAGKIVSLVPEHIVDKVVHQRRGGYCYEVNGLFSMALGALGVPYRWVAARPMFYPTRRPRTHMAVVAEIEGRQWLIDLGFGSYGITAPMALDDLDTEIAQGRDRFKLSRLDNGDWLLQAWVAQTWANQYSFDLTPQEWVDFDPVNYLNSTHPEAVFVKALLVIGHHPRGRTILFGNSLKTIIDGQTEQRDVAAHEIDALLQTHFQLKRPTSTRTPPLPA